jgi:hypothetical protein
MKKFTSLLIGVSLALAGAAFAQPTAEESPATGGKKQGKQQTEQTETKAPKTQGATGEQGAGGERGHKGKAANATGATTTEQGATGVEQGTGKGKGKGRGAKTESSATGTGTEPSVNAQTGAGATTETGAGMGKGKGKGRGAKAEASVTGATGTGASAEAGANASIAPTGKHAGRGEKGMKGNRANANAAASATAAPSVAAAASAAPSVAATGATGQTNATATGANATTTGGTVKVDKQKVQQVKQQSAQIKQQHVNFKAQPRPDTVQAVTFSQNYRIQGSDRWSGPQYEVFRSYHPERHDQGWYHSHYQRVELIAGGFYFWNNGYWFPAWGYDTGHEYYAYDAPIYVGHRAEPPDRVIADVQLELQQMGYYRGEVDGLLGPLTREALTAYQADQGLQVTAVIDEPTLSSLDMG